jgi:hypothetical protein
VLARDADRAVALSNAHIQRTAAIIAETGAQLARQALAAGRAAG